MVSQNYTGVNFLSRRNIENWHETHRPGDVTLETCNVINVFVSRPFKKVLAQWRTIEASADWLMLSPPAAKSLLNQSIGLGWPI